MEHVERYHSDMTLEGLHNYMSTRLPLQLNAREHLRLLAMVFVLVAASTIAIHLLIQQDDTALGMLIHATTIGLVYVVGIGIATLFLHGLHGATDAVRVWHIWAASLVGFVLGYYVLPINEFLVWLLGVDIGGHAGPLRFSQLLPIWFLLTYLFVNPYLNQGLRSELVRLKDINELLKTRDHSAEQPERELICFESGRTRFELSTDVIRNIAVDDHYCYVHFTDGDRYAKRDLAMPLRDVQKLLPVGFLRVHRSHVVNLKRIVTISRKNRRIRIVLDGDYEVPVSRHRLDEVLPLIRTQIESR